MKDRSFLYSTTCPHCLYERVLFEGEYANLLKRMPGTSGRAIYQFSLHCNRPECREIIIIKADLLINSIEKNGKISINKECFNIVDTYPKIDIEKCPKHVPERISRRFQDSVVSHNRSAFWQSASSFRTVVELALKDFDPNRSGTLYNRIDGLKNDGLITPAMADWAHRVRLNGNDSVHDDVDPTEQESKDLMLFTEMLLMYLFTLPEMVKKAQDET